MGAPKAIKLVACAVKHAAKKAIACGDDIGALRGFHPRSRKKGRWSTRQDHDGIIVQKADDLCRRPFAIFAGDAAFCSHRRGKGGCVDDLAVIAAHAPGGIGDAARLDALQTAIEDSCQIMHFYELR